MRIDVTVTGADGSSRDITVAAASGVTLGMLRACVEPGAAPSGAWVGDTYKRADTPLGWPELPSGAVVDLSMKPQQTAATAQAVQLDVVGGPESGSTFALRHGPRILGRSLACDVAIRDPEVSRRHARFLVTDRGVRVADAGSTYGTWANGARIDTEALLDPGVRLRAGQSTLSISRSVPARLPVDTDDGSARVHHVQAHGRRSLLPTPPTQSSADTSVGRSGSSGILASIAPTLGGVVMAVSLHNALFLVVSLIAPLALAGTTTVHWFSRRRARRREREIGRRKECKAVAIADGVGYANFLDPRQVQDTAAACGVRLWDQAAASAHFLSARVGLGDVADARQLGRHGTPTASPSVDTPISVDLRGGPFVITGDVRRRGLARWIAIQLAVTHSPASVQFALLLGDGAYEWRWARWLPHVGTHTAATAAERDALIDQLAARRTGRRSPGGSPAQQWLVLIVDPWSELVTPALTALLAHGPECGITALILDPQSLFTAPGSSGTCGIASGPGSRARIQQAESSFQFIADLVTAPWAESVARCLAPLTSATYRPPSSLPINLVDLLGLREAVDGTDREAILCAWRRAHLPVAAIGSGPDGTVHLDLVRDGPHILIAGTTGAGKSELLQTLVLTLAAQQPPDLMSFVLIDYKGGAAFGACRRLPHVLGIVTDLDSELTTRAIRSLKAEVRRREELLATAEVKDIDAYNARRSPETLARLVIVIDEFATLADELPAFVSGLIDIAQRGRSLGLHLVLATQRPSGAISPEIRANCTARVALRTATAADSIDAIDTTDAAGLDPDQPGHALLRSGATLQEFRVAATSCSVPPTGREPITVTPLDEWRRPLIDRFGESTDPDADRLTLLIEQASRGWPAAAPARPWLDPLPYDISLDTIDTAHSDAVAIGVADLPDEQRQVPYTLDLRHGGIHVFAGGPRSGRTTALMTTALSAARTLPPDALHVYALGASPELDGLRRLPHCGSVLELTDDLTPITALLEHLTDRLRARRGSHDIRTASAVLVIDGWDRLVSASEECDRGRTAELLHDLVRIAPSARMSIVVAADPVTVRRTAVLQSGSVVMLRTSDPAAQDVAPGAWPYVSELSLPGRGFARDIDATVQIAFAGAAPTHAEQVRAVDSVARTKALPSSGLIRISPLPRIVHADQLPPPPQDHLTIGVMGHFGRTATAALTSGRRRFLIAGSPRSGRSTLLTLLARQSQRAGLSMVTVSPRQSPLCSLAERHDIRNVDLSVAHELPTDVADADVVLIDDLDQAVDTSLATGLEELAAGTDITIVAAVRADDALLSYRGLTAHLRRHRCGILLRPEPHDGDIFGARLPPQRAPTSPGRGLLFADAAWGDVTPQPIQVALP